MSDRGAARLWMPVLLPPDWPDAERTSARPLVGHPGSPWLALVDHHKGGVEYLQADPPEVAAREREALHRLRLRERARWELDDELPVLRREGDDLTASDVLDPTLLREAATRLGEDTLFVAIPSRKVMLAGTDAAVVRRGAAAVLQRVHKDTALSRLVFEVRDGALVGAVASGSRQVPRVPAPPRRSTGGFQRPALPARRSEGLRALGLIGVSLLALAAVVAVVRHRSSHPAEPAPRGTVEAALTPAPDSR